MTSYSAERIVPQSIDDAAAREISWGSPDDDHYSGGFAVEEVADGTRLRLAIRTSASYPGIQESLEEALTSIAARLGEG